MNEGEAKARFAEASVARLATADADGRPHVVPVVFVVHGDTIHSGVDEKPKRHSHLKRLRNIAANPAVTLLVDHYEDDWEKVWWVRADGQARIAEDENELDTIRRELTSKYPQYVELDLEIGGAIAIDVDRWSWWSYRS